MTPALETVDMLAFGRLPNHVRHVAEVIRRVRPRVVTLPYWSDRHPDHIAGSRLVADAVATRLTAARFQQLIESSDAQFVVQTSFAFAEGCVVRHPVVRIHLVFDLPSDESHR